MIEEAEMSNPMLISMRVALRLALAAAVAITPALATAQLNDDQAVQAAAKSGIDRDLPVLESGMAATGEEKAQLSTTVAKYDALMARASPAVRDWVRTEGRQQAQGQPSQSAIAAAARARFGNDLFSIDIDALVGLILMESARESEQELRDQLAQMQKSNRQKQAQREAAQKMRQDRSALQDKSRAEYRAAQPIDSRAALAAYVARVSDGKDSRSEMSEMDQMQLQMVMDRRQKALEMLRHLMKKLSDTQNIIISNLK